MLVAVTRGIVQILFHTFSYFFILFHTFSYFFIIFIFLSYFFIFLGALPHSRIHRESILFLTVESTATLKFHC